MNYVPVILVVAATLASPSEPTDYKTAYKRAMEGDKPLLVLVTAEWCPPCQMMKRTTIPEMIGDKKFSDVHFATVDLDRDSRDAKNLIGNGTVPQLILFEKLENNKWSTRRLLGYQSSETVGSFIGLPKTVRTAEAGTLLVDQQ